MANEDFTTYTEVDANNKLTVTASKVDAVGALSTDNYRVNKDFGVNHFSGDFTHEIETGWTAAWSGTFPSHWFWGLGDVDGGWAELSGDDKVVAVLLRSSKKFQMNIKGAGSVDFDIGTFTALVNTPYYITIDRVDNGGPNSTGLYIVNIRSGSHLGTLEDTISLASDVGEQFDFRYAYVTFVDTGQSNRNISAFTQNFAIGEANDAFVKIMTTLYTGVEKITTVSKSTIAKIFNIPTST